MAGGWTAAALLPLDVALDWSDKHLKHELRQAWRADLHDWFASLPAHAMGSSPPPPPPAPPDLED